MWRTHDEQTLSTTLSMVDTRFEGIMANREIASARPIDEPQILPSEVELPNEPKPRRRKDYLPCERLLKKISRDYVMAQLKKHNKPSFKNDILTEKAETP